MDFLKIVMEVLHLFETTRFSNRSRSYNKAEPVLHLFETTRFSNLFIFSKVLVAVLHLFETTRFSNLLPNIFLRFLCFTLIRNYKVLKLYWNPIVRFHRFYTYSKLQGSQTRILWIRKEKGFYTYSKLQGSQTDHSRWLLRRSFYTYSKLQGSQTSNCHHRTYILGCIVVSKYYFTIKHLSLSIIKILLSPNSFLSSDSINNIETFL